MKLGHMFVLAAFLAAPYAFAGDISGFWKHAYEPGWIEINLEEGRGTVIRNDKFPERVGREIVKDLKADSSEENLWLGQVYAEKLGEYKKAEISLPKPDRMEFKVKVGFMSRTIEWVRVDEVPAAPTQ
ncbi:DUF2147 domain-containing protein [Candidatus Marimicrobium litorale]|jgi:hypothetical protein|uniref:DUF2147 domain-containing protein n=1 Tax=Candidatus Marimicrobium litorale TaxID=2518991 RepID=A0ABT3T4E9_9GAMM|nr:DUF2147 domain-containing protein [Candidatus Marimicrobium litorale]MCX2977133.1 DUF2147 domain-containing protein [Candidatus Marimicrobium litorale]